MMFFASKQIVYNGFTFIWLYSNFSGNSREFQIINAFLKRGQETAQKGRRFYSRGWDVPAPKASGWVNARCTCGEAVRFPDERSEEPCEARAQAGAREWRIRRKAPRDEREARGAEPPGITPKRFELRRGERTGLHNLIFITKSNMF